MASIPGMAQSRLNQHIQGLDTIMRRLDAVGKAGPRIAAAGLTAGLGEITKGIRRELPPEYKHLSPAIKHRFKKRDRRGRILAKSGAAVGKPAVPKRKHAHKGGKGLSSQNIHWGILATGERVTKRRRRRGRMPPIFGDVVERGFTRAESAAEAKIVSKMKERFAKEAAKARAK